MSEIKVNSIKGVGSTDAAITINNSDGTCTANLSNRQGKNLIINGAMQVAQRGTSSTTSGYGSVDRFRCMFGGQDEAPNQAQADVASGTTPYTLGFRKSFKLTNGNQTGGAGATDYIQLLTTIEAQDIANSGWNYISSTSFVTLSFWVKSSVAQNFYGALRTNDGTAKSFPFETGSLTADTWTKVTKTILGNSGITINNDNGSGLDIFIWPFRGTDYTGSVTLNQWNTWNASTATPDYTSTWWTTNDATFEVTGVQLEVSDHASDFQFRSFAEELALCQRYFLKRIYTDNIGPYFCQYVDTHRFAHEFFPCTMRTVPSITATFTRSSTAYKTSQDHAKFYTDLSYDSSTQANISSAEYSAEL